MSALEQCVKRIVERAMVGCMVAFALLALASALAIVVALWRLALG